MLIVCLAQAKAGEVVVLVASVCYDVVMCFLPLQTVRENGFSYCYQTFTIIQQQYSDRADDAVKFAGWQHHAA